MMNKINGLAGVAALALLAGLSGAPTAAFAQSRDMHRSQDRSRPDEMRPGRGSDSGRMTRGEDSARFGQRQSVTTQMLYDEVAREGEFVQIRGLGRAWKPADVDNDWKPYTNGRWIFNRQVGWYFESSEPWAEVTYHYGRWYDDPDEGWVWIADTEWAPAWVEWRYSRQHVGWRPLPPRNVSRVARRSGRDVTIREEWVFVPTSRITSERITTVMIDEPQEITTIYRETRPMGRVERRGSFAVNFGLDPDVVRRESRVTIESQNLPRAEAAPVPQEVRAISTEQRTTTSTTTEPRTRSRDQRQDATRPDSPTDTERTTTGTARQAPGDEQKLRKDQQQDATRPDEQRNAPTAGTRPSTETDRTTTGATGRPGEEQQRLRREQRQDAARPASPEGRSSTDRRRQDDKAPDKTTSGAARSPTDADKSGEATATTRERMQQRDATKGAADTEQDATQKRLRGAAGRDNAATAPDPRRRGEPSPTGAMQRQQTPGAAAEDNRRNDDPTKPSARSGGPAERPAAARPGAGPETTGTVNRPAAPKAPGASQETGGTGNERGKPSSQGEGGARKLPRPGATED